MDLAVRLEDEESRIVDEFRPKVLQKIVAGQQCFASGNKDDEQTEKVPTGPMFFFLANQNIKKRNWATYSLNFCCASAKSKRTNTASTNSVMASLYVPLSCFSTLTRSCRWRLHEGAQLLLGTDRVQCSPPLVHDNCRRQIPQNMRAVALDGVQISGHKKKDEHQ